MRFPSNTVLLAVVVGPLFSLGGCGSDQTAAGDGPGGASRRGLVLPTGRVRLPLKRDEGKVDLCHRGQTVVVAAQAVAAHLNHGDILGACESGCTPGSCDDGDLCTSDECTADGTCVHAAVSCNDDNPCTADFCSSTGGCLYTPAMNDCDDGNECTASDACANGTCGGTPIPGCCHVDADCADGNECTTDRCTSGTCSNVPVTCASNDACLVAFCDPADGSCAAAPRSCNDDVSCTVDSCNPTFGCVHDDSACAFCGDGIRNGNEQCDGADVGGLSCRDFLDPYGNPWEGSWGVFCNNNPSKPFTPDDMRNDCTFNTQLCGRCGNNQADFGEECDGTDIPASCATYGYRAGILTCSPSCAIIRSGCIP